MGFRRGEGNLRFEDGTKRRLFLTRCSILHSEFQTPHSRPSFSGHFSKIPAGSPKNSREFAKVPEKAPKIPRESSKIPKISRATLHAASNVQVHHFAALPGRRSLQSQETTKHPARPLAATNSTCTKKKVSRKAAKSFPWELNCGPRSLFPTAGFHPVLESFAPSFASLRLCVFA